jgi:hypothetical protein
VVYFLRDAAGREWVSVGTRGRPGSDDPRGSTRFCFDGWRYLRLELPANAPWDGYREAGSVWWGGPAVGPDTVVALPLTLERVAVERRTQVVDVSEVVPADPGDVLLGDLYAEYASADDRGAEAVRLSRLRAPPPNAR